MIRRIGIPFILVLALLVPWGARAQSSQFGRCEVDAELTAGKPLPRVSEALGAGAPVQVVVMGSTSSMGRGASARAKSYARQLEAAIAAALPGRRFIVADKTAEDRTALTMRDRIGIEVVPLAPALVIWEIGTTDAIRHLDPTDFGEAVDEGLAALHQAGIDVILVAPMFNPNAPSIINYEPFLDIMQQVAGAYEVSVFLRGAVMRQLFEEGNMSLVPGGDRGSATRAVDGLNACVARLLATMIARGAASN